MKRSKWIIILAVVLIISSLCACGAENKAEVTTSGTTASAAASTSAPAGQTALFDKPVNISLLMSSHSTWPYKEDWYVQEVLKKYTNVNLNVSTILDENNAFLEKVTIAISSGDVPDLIFPIGMEIQKKFNNQGVFANIKDYLDITPNFKKFMDENKAYMMTFTSADGKVYQFPSKGIGEANRRGWLYRKDIFDKNGIVPPTTSDELYAVCKKLKGLYPESYPYVVRDHDLLAFLMIAPSWGTDFHSPTTGFFRYDATAKDFIYGPIEDSFKEMAMFYNRLYKEELINPNFLTATTSEWESLVTSEKGYITVDYLTRIDSFDSAVRPTNPEFTLAYMLPVKGGSKGVAKMAASANEYYGFLPFVKAKNLKDVLKFCDWFYSDQARELLSWGEEGVTYKNENGAKKFIDVKDVKDLRIKTGLSTQGFFTLFDYDSHLSLASKDVSEAVKLSQKVDLPLNPCPALTESEQQWVNVQGGEITKHVVENISKFILGQRDFSEWDKYVQEVKDLGLEEFKNTIKTAYARATGG
jgi:putative aldouronate transport system substrate-binding protein